MEAVVIDFGLAKTVGSSNSNAFTTPGGPVGSLRWMAYELVDDEIVTFPRDRCDIFAFGMIVLEVLSNEVPWSYLKTDQKVNTALMKRRTPEKSIPADAHPDLINLMRRCWLEKPLHRPTSREVVGALERILQEFGGDPRDNLIYNQKTANQLDPRIQELAFPKLASLPLASGGGGGGNQ